MNLVDFESKVKALKVSFIKRILDDNPGKWKQLANHFYNIQDLDFYFKCNHKETSKIAHQWVETLVEIQGTLGGIRGTTK